MKLATLKNGSRDGQLVVVSRDLTHYTDASFLVPNLQAALDGWARIAPHLEAMAEGLEHGSLPSLRFHEHDAESPLPRAYQWAVADVAPAANAGAEPLIRQGGSDAFLGPRDAVVVADESYDIDMGGGVAVIVDDVPMGASVDEAREAIRLVMLVNDVSLRKFVPGELSSGSGFFRSSPPAAFSPVAATPDELGEAWDGGRLNLPLLAEVNGTPFGKVDAGADMTFDFPTIIAHAASTRPLSAGTIIGSGAVSGRADGEGAHGKAKTPFLRFGDTVRIEMKDSSGHSVFGAIEQAVEPCNT